MTAPKNTGTRDIPLKFAEALTKLVNEDWESGRFIQSVTPITADLLRYWFDPSFTEIRDRNFHDGQKQAILNAIYVHEVLHSQSVPDMYSAVAEQAEVPTDGDFINVISNPKYNFPKYCVKMATGTGKTWVLNALLVWQYLNAKYASSKSTVKFTKNFLLVAPGLIVYERLLDAFRGKETNVGKRDFNTSDIKSNEELFLPEKYRQDIYSFVQNSVADKTEIGKKTTGDGLIAITNWHALSEDEEEPEAETELSGGDIEHSREIAADVLPVTPGVATGNALDVLDNKLLRGGLLEYLSSLPDICVFNDEAHHIHENKNYGIVEEVEWQKSLNTISSGKGANYIQIDFSATPYSVTGGGKNETKHFFPHIIVNFELTVAMRSGLVKTFVLDERKEWASIPNEDIDFRSVRNSAGKVMGLSSGQRLMLRAGLERLKMLEKGFTEQDPNKHPKMMVICEDTDVSPFVCDFLAKEDGLTEADIMRIDSNKKGELKEEEWLNLKQKLFTLDKQEQPKIVVSVMMLREGFDVNNICVIVPLRSNQAPILLEQVLGRGLRLMWRGREYDEVKAENRHNIYDLKVEPVNYMDTLFVVEHPAFKTFYDELGKEMVVTAKEPGKGPKPLGGMVTATLKENYKDYDMFWPHIIKDKEETLAGAEISVDKMRPFDIDLKQLKAMVPNDNQDRFVGREMQVKTQFGEYKVSSDIFTAQSYNEYLQKMLNAITTNFAKVAANGRKTEMPLMQINQTLLISAIDRYIRTKLFNQEFDPMVDGNWRVLILSKATIIQHTMTELSKAIYEMHNQLNVHEAEVEKHWFSEVDKLVGRENFALDIRKSIYTHTFFPSNKGGLEKAFLEACDVDPEVDKIIKISEHKHTFARFRYLRQDGMLGTYYPDFIVKIKDKIYIVETKGNDRANNPDTQAKEIGALDWINKINELPAAERMNAEWRYVLLAQLNFETMHDQNASIREILEMSRLTRTRAEGKLF